MDLNFKVRSFIGMTLEKLIKFFENYVPFLKLPSHIRYCGIFFFLISNDFRVTLGTYLSFINISIAN